MSDDQNTTASETTSDDPTTDAAGSPTAPTDVAGAAEGSASDEADAARGGSEADDEPAIERGSAADDEPAIENGSASDAPATEATHAPGASADAAEAPTAPSDHARTARKTREGVVTSAAMDKTIVVTVTDRVRHPKYNKFVLRTKKLYTHDASNDAGVGDRVRVMETRPLSKNKRWRLVDVLERAR